jgi:hypothetical protein
VVLCGLIIDNCVNRSLFRLKFRKFAALLALIAVPPLCGLSSCAAGKNDVHHTAARITPSQPVPATMTATMIVPAGTKVVGQITLPAGFRPLTPYAPVWLENGTMLAAIGTLKDRTAVIGVDLTGKRPPFVIAEDRGPVVPGASIADVVPSPDGMTLALAAVDPATGQLDLILHDVIAPGERERIASFQGKFRIVTISWLDSHRLAVGLQADTSLSHAAAVANPSHSNVEEASPSGIYIIDTTGLGKMTRLNLECPLSPLLWNPQGTRAIGGGDALAPPVLISLEKPSCAAMRAGPIKPLGWSPDGNSFLFAMAGRAGEIAVYRHTITDNSTTLIAIASSSAAWTSTGDILAMGSQTITWRKAENVVKPWPVQMAMMGPDLPAVQIVSLGIRTTVPMLEASRMLYTQATNMAAIDLITPGIPTPIHRIVGFLPATRTGLTLATGPVAAPVLLSWSPDGQKLAILDASPSVSMMTVLAPMDELRKRPIHQTFSVVGTNQPASAR